MSENTIAVTDLTDGERRELVKLFAGQRYADLLIYVTLNDKGLVKYNGSIDMDILSKRGLELAAEIKKASPNNYAW